MRNRDGSRRTLTNGPLFPGLFALFAIFSTISFAQEVASSGGNSAPKYQSGDVELEHSRVYIFVGKVGLGHEHAVIGKLQSGKLSLASRPPEGQFWGKIVFDMTSFDADTPDARKFLKLEGTTDESTRKQVNDNMRGKDVLDVRKYPTAEFSITDVSMTGNKSKRGLPEIVLKGNFTLHGATKPIEVKGEVEDVNGWRRIRGAFAIRQSEYGIKPFTKMLGAIGVTDVLEIYGDIFVAP